VSVIDLPKRKLLGKIATPRPLAGIAISADGRTVVAVDDIEPALFLIDTASEQVAHTVRLEGVDEAAQIARYSDDFGLIGVTSLKSGTVSLIDPSFRRQTAIKVGEVLSLLQSMFEYVVVDAGRSFDPRPLEALNLADVVLLVGVPTVPAARNLRLSIEMLGELGLPPERLRLIMNRHQKRSGVNSRELEETIGLPISWQIPADDRVMTEAINAGVPPVLGASRSEIARSFVHLAEEIAALQIEAPPKSTSKAA